MAVIVKHEPIYESSSEDTSVIEATQRDDQKTKIKIEEGECSKENFVFVDVGCRNLEPYVDFQLGRNHASVNNLKGSTEEVIDYGSAFVKSEFSEDPLQLDNCSAEEVIDVIGGSEYGVENDENRSERGVYDVLIEEEYAFTQRSATDVSHEEQPNEYEGMVCYDDEIRRRNNGVYAADSKELTVTVRPFSNSAENVKRSNYNVTSSNTDSNTKRKTYSCQFCDKIFTRMGYLKTHISNCHLKEGTFSCGFCNKIFECTGDLNTHVNTAHSNEKFYRCKFCEQIFTQLGTFKYHVNRKHSKEKTYSCTYCEKTFTRMGNLNAHVNSLHTKEKTYVCKFCNKIFTYSCNLSKHVNTVHTKEKGFLCEHCGQTFTLKCNLNMHVNNFHRETKRYFCQFCNKGYTRLYTLNKHVNSVHT